VGLSATPNTAAKDLGAMLSAGNAAAADKAQGSTPGTDTFGNLLSDRLTQDAARRHADAQSAAVDAAGRHADIVRKDAARANGGRNDQDTQPADGNATAQALATLAMAVPDAAHTKAVQASDAKDLDTVAQQAADPAAQLAAQIEAARQAAQQAVQQSNALPLSAALLAQSGANAGAAANAAVQAGGKSAATDAATLAALSAANGAQGEANAAALAQAGQTALNAAKDAKTTANANGTPTPPATPLPDSATLAQALARTRAVADNTPPTARQLSSASSAQGTNGEHGLPRRADASAHSNVTQAATAAVADATGHASGGGNNGAQADAQGTGSQFQGALAHTNVDVGASGSAPTFTVGAAGATNVAAGASITPAQIHTLPTLGDAAWPHSMASQLAFMQVHRQSSAELQLSPAELGGLHVKLDVDNGAVNASFVCQHQAVAELVQDAMPRLRDAMQQGGMQLAQTSVSTGDFSQQQGASSQGASAQGNGAGNGGGNGGSRFGGDTQARTDAVAAAPQRASSHDGAIDTFA